MIFYLFFYSFHHKFDYCSYNKERVASLKQKFHIWCFHASFVTCQIKTLFSDKTESFNSECRSRTTFINETKFPVFKLLIRNLFWSSSMFCSNVFHSVLERFYHKIMSQKLKVSLIKKHFTLLFYFKAIYWIPIPQIQTCVKIE